MKAAYLHGFLSFPKRDSRKVQTLVERFGDENVIVPDYHPHSPELAQARLHEMLDETANEPIAVMGCSLGGFWTAWMAVEFGCPSVALNPQFNPHLSLKPGNYTSFDDKPIVIEDADIDHFARLHRQVADARAVPLSVLVNKDDELIPWQETRDFLLDNPLTKDFVSCDGGGHRVENIDAPDVQAVIDRRLMDDSLKSRNQP